MFLSFPRILEMIEKFLGMRLFFDRSSIRDFCINELIFLSCFLANRIS